MYKASTSGSLWQDLFFINHQWFAFIIKLSFKTISEKYIAFSTVLPGIHIRSIDLGNQVIIFILFYKIYYISFLLTLIISLLFQNIQWRVQEHGRRNGEQFTLNLGGTVGWFFQQVVPNSVEQTNSTLFGSLYKHSNRNRLADLSQMSLEDEKDAIEGPQK